MGGRTDARVQARRVRGGLGANLAVAHGVARQGQTQSGRSAVAFRVGAAGNDSLPGVSERGWQIGSGPTESQCKLCTKRLKGYGRRWDRLNATAVAPSTHWTETANGAKSGQPSATPRLKVAQNAGHTRALAAIDNSFCTAYNPGFPPSSAGSTSSHGISTLHAPFFYHYR